MNICFFSGEIIEEVIFKFIINKDISFKGCKHYSICVFKLRLENETVIEVRAYDEMADFCYRNLKIGNIIAVYGRINNGLEIDMEFIAKI